MLRHRRLLDHWIGELRDGKTDPETRDVLRVGLCQILILGIPDLKNRILAVREEMESSSIAKVTAGDPDDDDDADLLANFM